VVLTHNPNLDPRRPFWVAFLHYPAELGLVRDVEAIAADLFIDLVFRGQNPGHRKAGNVGEFPVFPPSRFLHK
jgi:hypothetical protein